MGRPYPKQTPGWSKLRVCRRAREIHQRDNRPAGASMAGGQSRQPNHPGKFLLILSSAEYLGPRKCFDHGQFARSVEQDGSIDNFLGIELALLPENSTQVGELIGIHPSKVASFVGIICKIVEFRFLRLLAVLDDFPIAVAHREQPTCVPIECAWLGLPLAGQQRPDVFAFKPIF